MKKYLFPLLSGLLISFCVLNATAGETKNVLWENFSPNGASFSKEVSIDFTTQRIHIEVDLSNCSKTNENIISIGKNIDQWDKVDVLHLFYTASSESMEYDQMNSSIDHVKQTLTGTVVFELSSQGFSVNGELKFTPTQLGAISSMTSIQIGSTQGSTRSWATYKEISIISPDDGTGGVGSGETHAAGISGITQVAEGSYPMKNKLSEQYLGVQDGLLVSSAAQTQVSVTNADVKAGTNFLTIGQGRLMRNAFEDLRADGAGNMDDSDQWRLEPAGNGYFRIALRCRDTFGFAYLVYSDNELKLLTLDAMPYNDLDCALWYIIGLSDVPDPEPKPDQTLTFTDSFTGYTQPESGSYTVNFTRNFRMGAWNTLCLPFAMTSSQLSELFGSDFQLAQLTDVTKGTDQTYDFEFTTEYEVEKGVPYLVRLFSGSDLQEKTITLSNVTDFVAAPVEVQFPVFGFVGSFNNVTIPAYSYVLSANKVYHTQSDMSSNAFRAYFVEQNPGPESKKINMIIDGGATGIDCVDGQMLPGLYDVYDLMGRCVLRQAQSFDSLPKGIYIVNGKKIVL